MGLCVDPFLCRTRLPLPNGKKEKCHVCSWPCKVKQTSYKIGGKHDVLTSWGFREHQRSKNHEEQMGLSHRALWVVRVGFAHATGAVHESSKTHSALVAWELHCDASDWPEIFDGVPFARQAKCLEGAFDIFFWFSVVFGWRIFFPCPAMRVGNPTLTKIRIMKTDWENTKINKEGSVQMGKLFHLVILWGRWLFFTNKNHQKSPTTSHWGPTSKHSVSRVLQGASGRTFSAR